ncbi:MAG: hypothetical protein GY868_18325, partial [Deltaproteobacteria bacterium]|nr:hypothetical protein [Deltaproteobacteria bacterium]
AVPDHAVDDKNWPQPAPQETKLWHAAAMDRKGIKDYIRLCLSDTRTTLEKCSALAALIFPAPDIIRLNYPPGRPWLLPLSYLRRWLHWLKK